MATATRVSQVFQQCHPSSPVLTTGGNITMCIAADAVLDGVVGQLKQKPTLANIKKAMGAVLAQAGEVATHAEKEAKKALISNGAQLTFSIDEVATQFKEKTGSDIDDQKALVYLAAVLEYLVAELCELTGNCARDLPSVLKMSEMPIERPLEGDWDEELQLAEAHHVLRAVAEDKELLKIWPNLGNQLALFSADKKLMQRYLSADDDELDSEAGSLGPPDLSVPDGVEKEPEAAKKKGKTKAKSKAAAPAAKKARR
jgi:hypothetical protein